MYRSEPGRGTSSRQLQDDGTPIRYLPVLLLSAAYAYLLVLLVPYLLHNNLLKGDGAGHLMLTEFTSEYLLPFGSGWCDRVWTGFPAGQLYPPLFHILAGFLAKAVGPAAAVKCLIAALWLLIPAAIYLLAGALARTPPARALVMIAVWAGLNVPSALLFNHLAMGSNLESSLGNGMFSSALGALAFVLLLWQLAKAVEEDSQGLRPPAGVGVALAVAVLSHAVWGLTGAMVALVAAVVSLIGAPAANRARVASSWAVTGLLAFALTGFFSVPLLAHSNLLSAVHLPAAWPVWFGLLAMGAAAAGVYRFGKLATAGRMLCGSALLLGALCLAGDAAGASFHFFRLTIPLAILLLALLALVAGQHAPGLAGVAFGWVAIVAVILFHYFGPVHPRGNPDMTEPKLAGYDRAAGRIMVLTEDMHAPGYHALPYLTVRAGGAVSHGISVESATGAQQIFGLVKKLSPASFTWGVDMRNNPALAGPDQGLSPTLGQLDALGFSHVLTDQVLPQGLSPAGNGVEALRFPNYFPKDPASLNALRSRYYLSEDGGSFRYVLLPLPAASLIDAGRDFRSVTSASEFPGEVDRWFAAGATGSVPLEGPEPDGPGCESANVGGLTLSESGAALHFDLEGVASDSGPCPVYVKMAWHPHWQARDRARDPLPLYRAGAGMAVLAPSGAVGLEYETGWCDYAGRALSLLGLLALGWLLYRRFGR